MDFIKTLLYLAFAVGLLWLIGPTAAEERVRDDNLLNNGSFNDWHDGGPAYWTFFADPSAGGIALRSTQLDDGQTVVFWNMVEDTPFAGVYQTVATIPDTTVRLTAATWAWSSDSEDEAVNPAWVRQRVGIDPHGGSDPHSPHIVWSMPGNFVNTSWGEIAVETTAAAEQVTVFLAANPNFTRAYNSVFYNNARLTVAALPLLAMAATTGPDPAPTTDPLLDGLIVGSGVLPGQQGISLGNVSRGMDTAVSNPITAGLPANDGPTAPKITIVEVLLFVLVIAVVIISGKKGRSVTNERI